MHVSNLGFNGFHQPRNTDSKIIVVFTMNIWLRLKYSFGGPGTGKFWNIFSEDMWRHINWIGATHLNPSGPRLGQLALFLSISLSGQNLFCWVRLLHQLGGLIHMFVDHQQSVKTYIWHYLLNYTSAKWTVPTCHALGLGLGLCRLLSANCHCHPPIPHAANWAWCMIPKWSFLADQIPFVSDEIHPCWPLRFQCVRSIRLL